MRVRLQKLMADAGLASRRASEALILAGRVVVNGQPVRQLGAKADPECDTVLVDGQAIKPRRRFHVAIHKPRGYLCSRQDAEGRHLVGELLPREWRHLYPVGRLDRDSEGLLFLTNDGEFCLQMTHPRYGARKTYRVTVAGRLDAQALARMTAGVTDRGEELRVDKARLVSGNASRSVVEVELREGKNRELRRLLTALGWEVERLQRLQIGPVKLGELPVGKWRVLTQPELRSLVPRKNGQPKIDR